MPIFGLDQTIRVCTLQCSFTSVIKHSLYVTDYTGLQHSLSVRPGLYNKTLRD